MRFSFATRLGLIACLAVFTPYIGSTQIFKKLQKTVKDVSNTTRSLSNDLTRTKKELKATKDNVEKIQETTGLGMKNIPKNEKQKNDSMAALAKMIDKNEELVYFNDFSFEDNIWKSYDNRNTRKPLRTEINSGEFSLLNGTTETVWAVKELGLDLNRDFVIETSIALVSGNEGDNFGINLGQRSNGYPNNAVGINLKGYYSVFERQGRDRVSNFIGFQEAASIIKDRKSYNKLRIEKIGRKINLRINDVLVTEGVAWNNPIQFYGNFIGFYAAAGQEIRSNYIIVKYLNGVKSDEAFAGNFKTNPPVISISEPKISSGNRISFAGKSMLISGKVSSQDAVHSLKINDNELPVDENGGFTAYVSLEAGSNKISLEATNGASRPGTFDLVVDQVEPKQKAPVVATRGLKITEKSGTVTTGNYYAIIIAAQNYSNEFFQDLAQPIADGGSLAKVLLENYNFDQKKLLVLNDPTRIGILRTLDSMQKIVTANDNLLIFYAGHGEYDKQSGEGYWAPIDSDPSVHYTMISNSQIRVAIKGIVSKHTLVITDACFAGGLIVGRGSMADASRAVVESYRLPSRKAITSGTLEEVPDKSVFVTYLTKRLRENEEKYLTAHALFSSFNQAVTNNSSSGQLPQYGAIQSAGDEGGDFIFIKK